MAIFRIRVCCVYDKAVESRSKKTAVKELKKLVSKGTDFTDFDWSTADVSRVPAKVRRLLQFLKG